MEPAICCPKCREPIRDLPSTESPCPTCGFVVQRTATGVAYDYSALLREAFPARYPLYRALCNNGFVSYHELASGSLSLPERKDVGEFGSFLAQNTRSNEWLCDVGCGPLAVPGYLQPLIERHVRLMGVEIYPTEFQGFRITGCAEFLPLPPQSIDVVIFATSLDHVCDLSATLREVTRVLRGGGRCCIWMGDRRPYWQEFFVPQNKAGVIVRRLLGGFPRQVWRNLRQGHRLLFRIAHHFKRGRYWEYENGSVFHCPPGAIDPFHSFFERPSEIIELASRCGLALTARERGSNGVFLCLSRPATTS